MGCAYDEEEMLMSATTNDLLSAFFDEMQQTRDRYSSFVKQAEEAEQPQLAKFFRAVVASESARGKLIRAGTTSHVMEEEAFYVCPQCGLVLVPEAPDKCPVDETPGSQFERIS